MRKKMIIMIVVLIVIFGGIFGYDAIRTLFIGKYLTSHASPPVTISTTTVKRATWHQVLSATGDILAMNGVDVSAQTSGKIMQINFKSGSHVQQGQLLLQLDDTVQKAQLKGYEAALRLKEISYQRTKKLYNKKFAAPSGLDQARADLQQARATVEQTKAIINEMHVRAPFTGKIGIRTVNLGEYITAGKKIASLQMLNPLFVNFYLPEQDLSYLKLKLPVTLNIDAYPKKKFSGFLSAINSNVDDQTRMILLQAQVQNNNNLLYPGLYANVAMTLRQAKTVLVVPQTAVTYSLHGDMVYVVTKTAQKSSASAKAKTTTKKALTKSSAKAKSSTASVSDKKALQRYVSTGDSKGGWIAITKGLQAGDVVVTSGQLKLQNGRSVIINNSIDVSQAMDKKNGTLY